MPEIDRSQVEKLAAAAAALAALVRELRGEIVDPSPAIAERVQRYLEAGVCLRCGQKKAGRYTRGMDANCYNQTLKDIERGDTTEAELIQLGRITARPQQPGRKANRPPIAELGELPEIEKPDSTPDADPEKAVILDRQIKARKQRRKS